jgi:hypothetical protein
LLLGIEKNPKNCKDFRILRHAMRVQWGMRARSFAILMAAFVGAFALFATPAEAGGRRYYKNYNGCYDRGYGRGYGYRPYRGYGYYRPVRYYRPAYYYPAPYFPGPAFQIGFSFGGGGYCR